MNHVKAIAEKGRFSKDNVIHIRFQFVGDPMDLLEPDQVDCPGSVTKLPDQPFGTPLTQRLERQDTPLQLDIGH